MAITSSLTSAASLSLSQSLVPACVSHAVPQEDCFLSKEATKSAGLAAVLQVPPQLDCGDSSGWRKVLSSCTSVAQFFHPKRNFLILIRCFGLNFQKQNLPPQVPHPKVKEVASPVLIPVPPMLPPVLTRIREAGFAQQTVSPSPLSSVWMLMVWPIPF